MLTKAETMNATKASQVDRFLKKAQQYRNQADKANKIDRKAQCLSMAAKWQKLAEEQARLDSYVS